MKNKCSDTFIKKLFAYLTKNPLQGSWFVATISCAIIIFVFSITCLFIVFTKYGCMAVAAKEMSNLVHNKLKNVKSN